MVILGQQVYFVYSQKEAFGVLGRVVVSPGNGIFAKLQTQGLRELQSILSVRCYLPESEDGVTYSVNTHPEHSLVHKELFEKLLEFQRRLLKED